MRLTAMAALGLMAALVQRISAAPAAQAPSSSLNDAAQATLSVTQRVTGVHPPIRSRYLRTNSYYDPEALGSSPPHFTVYDAVHKRFFVSNPYLNEIDVFDATMEIETAAISVPQAWGLDISPYTGSLYAGTLIGDIYQIDTGKLTVTKRYPSASIGPSGFVATTALVLSDGRLALQGGAAGILGVDGFGAPVVWSPVTNAMDAGEDGEGICIDATGGGFALSGDRKRILSTWLDSAGSGAPICSYDPIARVTTYGTFPFDTFVRQIIPTPDGKRFFLTSNLNGVGVFDTRTARMLGRITGPASSSGIPNAASGAVISLGGKTLYLADQMSGAVGAYDTDTLTPKGWIPSFLVNDWQQGVVISAIDQTGLIVGPIGHGVGFIDASQLKRAPPTAINSGFASAPTGPLGGGTETNQFSYGDVTDNAKLSKIYVGNTPGADASFSGSVGNENAAQVTTPTSNLRGAVDLAVVLSDGGVGITPEGFTYGPTILEVTPNGATAEGGQVGAIIGYGFGNSTSEVRVTVGGRAAPVISIYPSAPVEPYPLPVNGLRFKIPPGTAGTAVDVTVTTQSGSTTARDTFHYTAKVQSYTFNGALQAGIYDSHRDLYYFTGQKDIAVLSRSEGKWLAPITLPMAGSKTQLLAISESPDGSKIAVSDFGGQAIYVLDPDKPRSARRYPMPLDYFNESLLAPGGLAITNKGMVYFASADIGGTGTPAFQKLDTSNDRIINLSSISSAGAMDKFNRVLLSPDGSCVYASIEGASLLVETQDDQVRYSISTSNGFGAGPDLAVSGDGSTVDIGGYFSDPFLNAEAVPQYVDWETWLPTEALGQKLSLGKL